MRRTVYGGAYIYAFVAWVRTAPAVPDMQLAGKYFGARCNYAGSYFSFHLQAYTGTGYSSSFLCHLPRRKQGASGSLNQK
jgi:hypothetical protein